MASRPFAALLAPLGARAITASQPFPTFLAPLEAEGPQAWPHGRPLHSKPHWRLGVRKHGLRVVRYTLRPIGG